MAALPDRGESCQRNVTYRGSHMGCFARLSPIRSNPSRRFSDRAAALEGATQRDLVGVLEITTDGQAASQTGDRDAHRLDQQSQVRGRGLALGVRVGGED